MIFYGPEPRKPEPEPKMFLTRSEVWAALFLTLCVLAPLVAAYIAYK